MVRRVAALAALSAGVLLAAPGPGTAQESPPACPPHSLEGKVISTTVGRSTEIVLRAWCLAPGETVSDVSFDWGDGSRSTGSARLVANEAGNGFQDAVLVARHVYRRTTATKRATRTRPYSFSVSAGYSRSAMTARQIAAGTSVRVVPRAARR